MEKDTWEPLSVITARLMVKLEEDQRRLFENLCRKDGIRPKGEAKGERENARV